MKVREAIYERRAIRAYEPQVVEEKILRQLIEAAVHAPSAMNAQPWHFAVVQNRTILPRYSERAKAMMLEEMHGDPKASHYERDCATVASTFFTTQERSSRSAHRARIAMQTRIVGSRPKRSVLPAPKPGSERVRSVLPYPSSTPTM